MVKVNHDLTKVLKPKYHKKWVVLKPGESAEEGEIIEFCRDKLAVFKIPSQVEFRDELPKTMVGKILRRELVREHEQGLEEQGKKAQPEPVV